MPGVTLQSYFSTAIGKATDDLLAALDRLPEDKRQWSSGGNARSAMDMVAECALLNGATAAMITAKAWVMGDDFAAFETMKSELAKDESKCRAMLLENTKKVQEVVANVADGDLEITVDMPWMPITLAQACAYPFWNTCYHEGQINYIAMMLGSLE